MGVPKFFRYISERYPCLSELVRENQVPEFDNLYLDMNGIIHNCSHPDDSNVHFRITEEQIFKDIFACLEMLFTMIKPKKLFFLAVDGVAPRAKMNQQRGRRFRSAKEAEILEAKAKKSGDVLPEEARFDSNCITPGTPFMVRLNDALKYLIQYKISKSPAWRNCKVILSGHETPGEGEHKIMEYIRFLKAQKNYDPNTRHCLYGLDADLIMLGLCTHERHFSLLREEVKFGKKAKKSTMMETRFFLLHLSLMREYLEQEFHELKDKIQFPFNIENIIDDWVLMGFLVGNDFIPNIPNLHINSNALPFLYHAYIRTLPTLDGYINEGGFLNMVRLEAYLANLSDFDRNFFQSQYEDIKFLEAKKGSAFNERNDETFGTLCDDEDVDCADLELAEMVKQTEYFGLSDDDNDDENVLPFSKEADGEDEEIFERLFQQTRRDYYVNKLKYPELTPEVLAEQALCYISALQWTLSYYYHGVQSWSWYYPHHYAPFISDLKNFKDMPIKFEMSKPFLPFQQLLSVLPAASKELIPDAYKKLMTSPDSSIIDYYPKDFETDLNGKKQEWEAVVLIPFIDEKRLLDAMKSCEKDLSPEEKARNIHGPMYSYTYCDKSQGSLEGPYTLPDLGNVFCIEQKVFREDVHVPKDKLVLGPSEGAFLDYYFPGFPTMKFLKYHSEMRKSGVRVFDQPSREDNMIICVDQKEERQTCVLAGELLGRSIYVGWPHMYEAKVMKISDADCTYSLWNGQEKTDPQRFEMDKKTIFNHHMSRMGIDPGSIEQIVTVVPCIGDEYVYENKMYRHVKSWSRIEISYPVQCIVADLKAYKKKFKDYVKIDEVYKAGTIVFMMSNRSSYYGSIGEVLDTSSFDKTSRITVVLNAYDEPDLSYAKQLMKTTGSKYMNSYTAAAKAGISVNVFNRITGIILVYPGQRRRIDDKTPKTNIGLQLKFSKQNEELVGYTQKVNNKMWVYSDRVVEIVQSYYERLPKLFELLESMDNNKNEIFFEADLFESLTEENCLSSITKWIQALPHRKAERRPVGNTIIDVEVVEELLKSVEKANLEPFRKVQLQIKPFLLFVPSIHHSNKMPDVDTRFQILDRVIVAKYHDKYPIGTRGTIIGIHQIIDPNPVRQECKDRVDRFCEVLFDVEVSEGSSVYGIAQNKIGRILDTCLINISFGQVIAQTSQPNNGKQPTAMNRQNQESVRKSDKSYADAMKANETPKKIQILKNVHLPENQQKPVANVESIKQDRSESKPAEEDKVEPDIAKKLAMLAVSGVKPTAPPINPPTPQNFMDFWNSIKKDSNIQITTSQNQPNNLITMSDSNEKSEKLKMLLKVNDNAAPSTSSAPPSVATSDSQSNSLKNILGITKSNGVEGNSENKVNLNIGSPPVVLPTPPSNWIPKTEEPLPEPVKKFFTQNPQFKPDQRPQPQPFFQNNRVQNQHQHRPKPSPVQPILHSAINPFEPAATNPFIPLQAARKNTKISNIEFTKKENVPLPDVVNKKSEIPLNTSVSDIQTNVDSSSSQVPESQTKVQIPNRKSRLALKFPTPN